jgi:hypothetical protein
MQKARRTAETSEKPGCACGAALPHHLADLMNNDARCSHICRCNRRFKIVDMAFVEDGTQANPFAATSN